MKKELLRIKYKKSRSELKSENIEDLSISIANKLLKMDIWEHTTYHLFLPIINKKEVNTEFVLHILQGKDKSVVIPKSDFESGTMQSILLQENTVIRTSEYGIPEPESGIFVDCKQIDVIFVPLLAFDETGNRLGYGKGFYDRFLAKCMPDIIKIGLSFFSPEQLIETEKTDIPLDYCVTPNKVYQF